MDLSTKEGVVELLDRLEKVCGHLKDQPAFVKDHIALQSGCLVSDIDDLEADIVMAKETINDNLYDEEGVRTYYEEESDDD